MIIEIITLDLEQCQYLPPVIFPCYQVVIYCKKIFKIEEPVQVLENVVFFHKFTMYSVIEIDFDIFDVSRTFTIMVGYVFLIRYTFSENKSDPVP